MNELTIHLSHVEQIFMFASTCFAFICGCILGALGSK